MLIDHYQSTNHLPSHKSLPVIHCFHQPCILELRTELIQWQTDFRGISYFILGHLDTNGQPDKFIGRSMHFEFSLWFMRQVDTTNMASVNSYLDIDIHIHKIHTFVNTLTNTHSQIRSAAHHSKYASREHDGQLPHSHSWVVVEVSICYPLRWP